MAERSGNMNRRQLLTALGAGATAGLAGCQRDNEGYETGNDDNLDPSEDGNSDEDLETGLKEVVDANLSEKDPANSEPGNHEVYFTQDTAELNADILLQLTNGIQESSHEASSSDLEVEDDNAVLYLPQELLPHGDTELTATINGEEYNASFVTQTPSAFPIDRRVEGEQASNFETPWAFAQHDLDGDEAREAHLNYVNDEFAWDYDKSNPEYSEAFNEIASLNPDQQMETILTRAGNIASDIDGKRSPGTTQSGPEVGFTTSEIARRVNDEIDDNRLKTMNVSNPENSQDRIIQLDAETETVYIQRPTKVSEGLDEPVVNRLTNISNSKYARSTIFGFEPGYVDGIDDENASSKTLGTQASIMSMAEQANTANTNYVMNDYFLEEASNQIFEEGDVESVSNIASAVAELALATDQATSFEARNPENNEDLPSVSDNGRIAVYIDEDESLEDATLAYVQDENLGTNLYDRVVETAEPAGRNEIEEIVGLN
ncbi:MAG: hypothetical protein R6V35_04320 [Candidatus Nanohaloarchaea archaeon]